MPKLQNVAVTRNNDEPLTFVVDSDDIASGTLAGATVEWSVYGMSFAVPIESPQLILKDSFNVGGVMILESPPLTFVVDLAAADTEALDPGNYYHEGLIVDSEGRRSTVVYGAMAVTLSLE